MQLFITTIEFGTPEYDEVIALRTLVLRKPLGLEFNEDTLALEYKDIHFAVYTGNWSLIGCCLLRVDDLSPEIAVMKQVAIHPDWQSKGVGRQLAAYFEAYCKENNFKAIDLHARDTAVNFYIKNGYEVYGDPFTEVGIPHRYMKKDLL